MKNKQLSILVAVLIFIALTIFGYKRLVLNYPLQPDTQTDVWNVEIRARFDAANKPVKYTMMLPQSGRDYAIVNEQFVSRGYGISIRKLKKSDNRKVIWSIRKATGEQVLYYQATVKKEKARDNLNKYSPPLLASITFTEAEKIAALALLTEVRAHSADSETFTLELIKRLNEPHSNSNTGNHLSILLTDKPDTTRRLNIAIQVLAMAGIPARIANGIRLEQIARTAKIFKWVEVYYANQWHTYYPTAVETQIPGDYLTLWRGSNAFFTLKGGRNIHTRISVILNKETSFLSMVDSDLKTPALTEFSLLGLPIETQAVYHALLPVPLAVFILVLLRNVVGVKTFGTFMPGLIALAFRESGLLWGLFMFSFIVSIGLLSRFLLERLKLLLVARLAAILIIVVILMVIISIISFKLGLHRGLSIALFPMVILSMTIERMTIVWEERGAVLALQQAAGSLLVAVLAYPILNYDFIQYFLFIYTELLLVILALTILLGRYTGYRLTELWRFKVLAKESR